MRTNDRRSAAIAATAGRSFRKITAAVSVATFENFFFSNPHPQRLIVHGILDPIKRSALRTVYRKKISCNHNTLLELLTASKQVRKKNYSTATDKKQ